MTLLDLLKLIKRNLKLVILLPVICAAVTIIALLVMPANYTASASLVTNGDFALAQGFASTAVSSSSYSDVTLSTSPNSSSKQITITGKGSNADSCVKAVNAAAAATNEQIKGANGDAKVVVSEASSAANDSPSIPKSVIVAILAGLFIAICVIVVIDMIKAPIKSKENAESICELPILDELPTDDGGERLFANIQFRSDGRPSSIAVVPVGNIEAGASVARELAQAIEHAGMRVKVVRGAAHARQFKVNIPENAAVVVDCPSLEEGMGAAHIAHDAQATVVCVSEWESSQPQLVSTVQELTLAKANITGIAYVS